MTTPNNMVSRASPGGERARAIDAALAAGYWIIGVCGDAGLLVDTPDGRVIYPLAEIQDAANAPDRGDGMALVYLGLWHMAEDWLWL